MSTAERLREEGRQQGVNDGRKEGMKEGMTKGQRGLLLMQLEQRFGPLPARVSKRVSRASASEISVWARAVLTASSLGELAGLNGGGS